MVSITDFDSVSIGSNPIRVTHRRLAHLAEHLVYIQRVIGSSPISSTIGSDARIG